MPIRFTAELSDGISPSCHKSLTQLLPPSLHSTSFLSARSPNCHRTCWGSERTFTNVLTNDHHLLSYILPERNNRIHNLRPRRRELILTKGDVRNFLQDSYSKMFINYFLRVLCSCYAYSFSVYVYVLFVLYGCALSASIYTLNWTESQLTHAQPIVYHARSGDHSQVKRHRRIGKGGSEASVLP